MHTLSKKEIEICVSHLCLPEGEARVRNDLGVYGWFDHVFYQYPDGSPRRTSCYQWWRSAGLPDEVVSAIQRLDAEYSNARARARSGWGVGFQVGWEMEEASKKKIKELKDVLRGWLAAQ